MLVLTRRRDEIIRIGDDIMVQVVAIKGDRVRIGIAAPADVAVHREEIWQGIQREKREGLAAKS